MLTKGQRTKQRIFDMAITLIKERGYDSVSVADICEKADVAKGTFYVHYKAKEDIIRESYYSDMNIFIEQNYAAFVEANPNATVLERLRKFLVLELVYSDYTGVEVTSRAFSANFAICSPGKSFHFEKRIFTHILRELLDESKIENREKAFLELETLVRGSMASWCFSGGAFSIVEMGSGLIDQYLETLFD